MRASAVGPERSSAARHRAAPRPRASARRSSEPRTPPPLRQSLTASASGSGPGRAERTVSASAVAQPLVICSASSISAGANVTSFGFAERAQLGGIETKQRRIQRRVPAAPATSRMLVAASRARRSASSPGRAPSRGASSARASGEMSSTWSTTTTWAPGLRFAERRRPASRSLPTKNRSKRRGAAAGGRSSQRTVRCWARAQTARAVVLPAPAGACSSRTRSLAMRRQPAFDGAARHERRARSSGSPRPLLETSVEPKRGAGRRSASCSVWSSVVAAGRVSAADASL